MFGDMQMKYNIIGSSSKGNCIIVEDILMLDCGVSYTKIKKYLSKVKLIFISHSHQDHLLPSTIKKIAYNYPTIKFISGSDMVIDILVQCGVAKKNIYALKSRNWYDLGAIKVRLEQLYHDTPNYALKWELNGKKGVYIVDTSNVNDLVARDYDLYLIEANYNEKLLGEHIDNCEDENQLYYLNRVGYTHLSDTQCNDFLIENMGENSVYEKIHKSSYNYEEID